MDAHDESSLPRDNISCALCVIFMFRRFDEFCFHFSGHPAAQKTGLMSAPVIPTNASDHQKVVFITLGITFGFLSVHIARGRVTSVLACRAVTIGAPINAQACIEQLMRDEHDSLTAADFIVVERLSRHPTGNPLTDVLQARFGVKCALVIPAVRKVEALPLSTYRDRIQPYWDIAATQVAEWVDSGSASSSLAELEITRDIRDVILMLLAWLPGCT